MSNEGAPSSRPPQGAEGLDPAYCLGEGLYEFENFLARYRRLGKGAFEDWQIVSAVASSIYSMLKEGRDCPAVEKLIVDVVVKGLEEVGIDRRAVHRAYLHGIDDRVLSILGEVFPRLVSLSATRPQPLAETSREASVAESSSYIPVEVIRGGRPPIERASADWSRPRRGYSIKRKLKRILSTILAVIFLIAFIALIIAAMYSAASWISNWSMHPHQQAIANVTPAWVLQFINDVNYARTSNGSNPLQYCPELSQFAQLRFETIEERPDISHYGFDEDFNQFFNNTLNIMVGEEVLSVSPGETPSQFANEIKTYAPLHWQGLIDPSLIYYGWYGGVMEQPVCYGKSSPIEIPGPGINITQYLLDHGCSSVSMEPTYVLVVEEANQCPGG